MSTQDDAARNDNPLKALERASEAILEENKVSPLDFCKFLPWACRQMALSINVIVTSEKQFEYMPAYVSNKDRKKKQGKSKLGRLGASSIDEIGHSEPFKKSPFSDDELVDDDSAVTIRAVYSGESLVKIKFVKNKHIPREIIKIISLIAQYHVRLYEITVDSGMDEYTIHELDRLLNVSSITEMCLDNTFIQEANYYILLEYSPRLKLLSLARCRIGDDAVQLIAARLAPPQMGSMSLCILNLSSNRITDEGAQHLAVALRYNRQLCYLSLASNMLTDEGAQLILNTLKVFPLTHDEIVVKKTRYIKFLRRKFGMIHRILAELKQSKDKGTPIPNDKARFKKPEISAAVHRKSKSKEKSDEYEIAAMMASELFGKFDDDPFGSDCIIIGDHMYSNGNTTLAYLNLSYNNLSYCMLKTLLEVVKYQRELDRKPRGLMIVSLEGNPLPVTCQEFIDIDGIMQSGLIAEMSATGKRSRQETSAKGH